MKKVRIRLAGGSYWLSIPCIVSGIDRKTHARARYLAKIVNDRSVIKHHYITALRNLGVLAEGAGLKFEDYEDPRDMACFERENLLKLREHGVRVPDVYGIHRLGGDDYMIVMEFIEGMPLSHVPMNENLVGQVFRALRTIHDHGMFHGDVKLDNFMCAKGQIVVFDSLRIGPGELRDALAFDLACAICALAQKAPLAMVLQEAKKYYSDREIADAARMVDIALNRADLELTEEKVKEVRQALGG
jgi:tRNA A-37 threonylcarbamoyl transferase component Bud32